MQLKNIKKIVLFLIILAGIIGALEWGIDLCYNGRVSTKFTQLFKHKIDAGVMVFGSSVAYYQINPNIIDSITGEDAYNMGWYGTFFVQYSSLIDEYLTYEKKCKCIVIACDFENLGKNGLITRPDLFYSNLGNKFVYRSLSEIEPKKIFLAKYLPGYKLTLLNKAFYHDILWQPRDNPKLLGYQPIYSSWNKADTGKPFYAPFDDHIYQRLRSTIEDINKKGIKVIIVMTPVYQEGYKLVLNADDIKSKYRSLVNKNTCFLDYTRDSICNLKDNFVNFSHVNINGSDKFSVSLAKDIQRIMQE